MKVPHLIHLFRSLESKEVKLFGQFMQSPYYNATPKMRALYRYLKKEYPECLFTEKEKESSFAQIFKGEPYNTRKMNNLIASLSSILQDFLLIQDTKRETKVRKERFFEVYWNRHLNDLSHRQLMSLKKDIDNQDYKDAFYYHASLMTHHKLYFHPTTKHVLWKEKEDYDYLKKAWQDLDLLYAHLRLQYICEMTFRDIAASKKFVLTQEETSNIESLIAHYDVPLLEIFFLLYKILQIPDKNLYNILKNKIFAYIDACESKEPNYLLTFLKNYQHTRITSGNTDALHEFFDLYLFDLKKNIYIDSAGHFSQSHFANISVVASELGKTTWLAAFIEEKQGDLRSNIRENVVNFSLACLHFANREYDETLRLASLLRHTYPAFALSCWTLEVRAYYMMKDEHENWDTSIKRFQAYLRNQDKLDENIKQANRNFNTFIRLLYRAAYYNKYTKEDLLDKLESQKNIVCKYWLKQQIEQLK